MSGFKKFLLRGNLIDLAIAVVVGAAFGAVVTALVKDLITPLIAALGGKQDFSALFFTVNGSRFLYGDFINAVLSFLVIAAVIYWLVFLPVNALAERLSPKPPAPAPTKKCIECLSDIPEAARRCAFCTSVVGEAATA